MGRIRSIKPEVLDDEVAAALSDKAWRLWVSSWVLADDYGCLRMGSRYLAAQVWQDSSVDPMDAIVELVRKGFVTPYAVRGQRYGKISGWGKHQRIDNAGKIGKVADPSEDDGSWDPVADAEEGLPRVELGDADRSPTSIRALTRNLAAENAMPKVTPEARGSRVAGARNPAAGRDHDHERDHDRDPDQAGAHAHARIQVRDPLTACRAPDLVVEPDREPPSADRGFEIGTAGSQAARDAFVDAVTAATKSKFTLNRAPYHAATLCDVLNTHASGGSKSDRLAWLASAVAAWVVAADPAYTAGWAPAKFLDWLNAGQPMRSNGTGRPVQKERKVKYLTDEEALHSPHDAQLAKKFAGVVPPPTLDARPPRPATQSPLESISGAGTAGGSSGPRSARPESFSSDDGQSTIRRVVP